MRHTIGIILALGLLSAPAFAEGDGRGCCSHHGGVACCAPDGKVTCADGEVSDCTCSIELEGPEKSEESWEGGVESNDGSNANGDGTSDPTDGGQAN